MHTYPHSASSPTYRKGGGQTSGGGQNEGGVTAPMITETASVAFTQ
jgi:hypothetical protein